MSAPSSDSAGIRQVVRALVQSGHTLRSVYNGEENVRVANEAEAVAEVTSVDEARLYVGLPQDAGIGWVFFVLGNDPEEVVCDYTTNLDPTVERVTGGWW